MKKKFYRPILYYLLVLLRWVFNLLPYRVGFSFGGTVGKAAFYLLKKEREKTLNHLRIAFGAEKSEKEIRNIGRAVFEHYGQTVAELALIDKILPRLDEFVTAEGFEYFDAAQKEGKGLITPMAHFGNWELMGGYTKLKGYPAAAVGRKIYYAKYDGILSYVRRKMQIEVFDRDGSLKPILSFLKRNGMLGIVADQDVEDKAEGVFVDFFGRSAWTPAAPVRLAMATGAHLVPAMMIRKGTKHHMIVGPRIELTQTGNKEEDTRTNTQKWVAFQEKFIREYPHLWVWNHKRWKTLKKHF